MNEKNLIPFDERTKSEQREIARQGGIASGKVRREKKLTQKILQELVNLDVATNPLLTKIAKQVGISSDKSIHELATAVLFINTLKKGTLDDLEQLQKMLGEKTEYEDNNNYVEETLAIIKECAYADRDKP